MPPAGGATSTEPVVPTPSLLVDRAREALVAPETWRIGEILADFRTRAGQMAVVIDGWNVFEEIARIEDVLEESRVTFVVGDSTAVVGGSASTLGAGTARRYMITI